MSEITRVLLRQETTCTARVLTQLNIKEYDMLWSTIATNFAQETKS